MLPASAERELDDGPKSVFVDDEVEPQVLQVIRGATKYITFVTPYVDLWMHLTDAMHDAINKGVEITFFIREGENRQRPEDLKWLRDNVKVYEIPNLHSKIYLNETTILVSSMNITESSTRNSKEFAMIVRRQGDATVFREYVSRLIGKAAIAQSAHPIRNYVSGLVGKATMTQPPRLSGRQSSEDGYCIRSRDKIPFNAEKPLCADCFSKWNKYHDEDYAEKYCHSCGKSAKTTFAKPLCMVCWKKSN
jgi:phosphatidylserine/phosphatidylglycerophosphate/cardiolipin synthase-like enzyme